MNKIPNRQAICDTLMKAAAHDPDITVLCSDSRGSASAGIYAEAKPFCSAEFKLSIIRVLRCVNFLLSV